MGVAITEATIVFVATIIQIGIRRGIGNNEFHIDIGTNAIQGRQDTHDGVTLHHLPACE
jgi:hypothetical protein